MKRRSFLALALGGISAALGARPQFWEGWRRIERKTRGSATPTWAKFSDMERIWRDDPKQFLRISNEALLHLDKETPA